MARSAVLMFAQLGFSALGQPVDIILPTEYHALLSGDYAAFYQYIKRDFEEESSTPWQGVHLELNLLLNWDFEKWSNKYFPKDGNRHGNYNGQNLDGFDIARLYLELNKNPQKTIPEFFQQETTWYRVLVPASTRMDLLQRYPWLSGGQTAAKTWEISFNQAGIPIRFEANVQNVQKPALTFVKFSPYPYGLQTRGYIQGSGSNYSLSKEGARYLDLISPAD